jgi:2-oxoglutarate ferredoxin oxidoreductase subunit gamma
MKHEFRFSGTGGQGLITAGIILAEAALLDGKSGCAVPVLWS